MNSSVIRKRHIDLVLVTSDVECGVSTVYLLAISQPLSQHPWRQRGYESIPSLGHGGGDYLEWRANMSPNLTLLTILPVEWPPPEVFDCPLLVKRQYCPLSAARHSQPILQIFWRWNLVKWSNGWQLRRKIGLPYSGGWIL
jgi:hypothetical protein